MFLVDVPLRIRLYSTTGTGVGEGVGVGTGVGVAVGAIVGVAVGAPEGGADGVTVGVGVGCAVGIAVGVAVGTAVGVVVGAAVGATVGDGVAVDGWSRTISMPTMFLTICAEVTSEPTSVRGQYGSERIAPFSLPATMILSLSLTLLSSSRTE